jgi:cytochrome c-type biogenesis protein CcmF
MTTPDEREFRALLRWYPRRWRERNESIVLGTMLDDAEARGLQTPDASMRRGAILHGLGARLDRRTAIVAASLAAALALAGIPLLFLGVGTAWLIPGFGVVPLLILVAVGAASRTRGIISAAEALTGVFLALPATTLSTLVALSWSVGFDEADAGTTRGWFAQAFIWFAAAAWLAAMAWGAVVVGGMLRSPAMTAVWARLAGAACAAVAYPFLAFSLLSPASGALLAIATLGSVILLARPRAPISNPAPPAPRAARTTRPASRTVLVCAVASAVAGAAAVLFALTGSGWPGSTLDGTGAMRFGIVAGFIAALPYCATIGLMRSAHHRALHAWGPALLIAGGFVIAATENIVGGGDGNRIVWALLIAGLPLGGAVTWILSTGCWAARTVQTTIAIMCGAAVVVTALAIQMLPFLLPIAALILAVGEGRRLSTRRTHRDHRPYPASA